MPIHSSVKEFLDEQTQGLTEMVDNLRKARVAAARRAATESAVRVRSINLRVRELARSGLRITSISHGTVQNLIELQGEIVTGALADASERIRRLAETESVRDLARQQVEVLQAARQRIVDDIARSVTILRAGAGDVRKVAKRAMAESPAATAAKSGRKRTVRAKAKAKARPKRKVAKAPRKAARRRGA